MQEGENVAKLEKADILELTVRHLHQLQRHNGLSARPENSYAEKFKAGFRHCAAEVSSFLGVIDHGTSAQIVNHLNTCMTQIDRSATPNQQHAQYIANRGLSMAGTGGRPAIQIQSPNQINAHAMGAPMMGAAHGMPQQFAGDVRMAMANQMHMRHMGHRSSNSSPETRIITPPLSPKIEVDASMWRPW